MNTVHTAILIAVCAAATIFTRAVPFLLFGGRRKMPAALSRAAAALPPAIIAVLVIYCLKADILAPGPGAAASLLAICATAAVHLWKRNTLLSISVGTIIYMVLIRIFAGLM